MPARTRRDREHTGRDSRTRTGSTSTAGWESRSVPWPTAVGGSQASFRARTVTRSTPRANSGTAYRASVTELTSRSTRPPSWRAASTPRPKPSGTSSARVRAARVRVGPKPSAMYRVTGRPEVREVPKSPCSRPVAQSVRRSCAGRSRSIASRIAAMRAGSGWSPARATAASPGRASVRAKIRSTTATVWTTPRTRRRATKDVPRWAVCRLSNRLLTPATPCRSVPSPGCWREPSSRLPSPTWTFR